MRVEINVNVTQADLPLTIGIYSKISLISGARGLERPGHISLRSWSVCVCHREIKDGRGKTVILVHCGSVHDFHRLYDGRVQVTVDIDNESHWRAFGWAATVSGYQLKLWEKEGVRDTMSVNWLD